MYCSQAVHVAPKWTTKMAAISRDYLIQRGGLWHYHRRVPTECQHVDRRSHVKVSTKVKVANDRTGTKAGEQVPGSTRPTKPTGAASPMAALPTKKQAYSDAARQ